MFYNNKMKIFRKLLATLFLFSVFGAVSFSFAQTTTQNLKNLSIYDFVANSYGEMSLLSKGELTTTTTAIKDTYIEDSTPTTNYGSSEWLTRGYWSAIKIRVLYGFKLPVITGGDYNATVIDTITPNTGENVWILFGTGAENPINSTWGDNVGLEIKPEVENAEPYWILDGRSKETALEENKPYLKIYYTEEEITPPATTSEEMLEKITSPYSTSTFFYLEKKITFGDFIIITFLFIFLVFSIVKFCFDWFIPKKLDWKKH
ncbi:MAG: hypothetical protein NT116_05005 [Candidatus Parcubacteria bacterium]|nr:hypothetical protein [Candidatus Parcubacteria bacterium]